MKIFFKSLVACSGFALCLGINLSIADTKTCTYTTYIWNVDAKKSIDHQVIKKPYAELTDSEKDPVTQCTVCEEDQIKIMLPGIQPFKVCKRVAGDIEKALLASIEDGQVISDVVGYRVGKTKGKVDAEGNRTDFSNHSFGTAIDINTAFNGLYDHCPQFGSTCRLIKGGHWRPGDPGSITNDSPIIRHMRAIGFKWGGQIAGNQKDFMHFSVTGY